MQVDGYHKVVQNGMCGSTISVTLLLDFFDTTLESEVRERQSDGNPYQATELVYLLNRVSLVFALFESHQIVHGCINPGQLYLDQDGFVHIYDNAILCPHQSLVYLTQHKDKVLPSPEQLDALREKNLKKQYDVFQSDVFSLGMTMLQVSSLRPSRELYDWKSMEVKWDKVEDALTGLLNNYSGDYVGQVRTMLSKEPTHRPTFQDIHNWTEQPQEQPQQLYQGEQQQ